jgi:hypothetical protein
MRRQRCSKTLVAHRIGVLFAMPIIFDETVMYCTTTGTSLAKRQVKKEEEGGFAYCVLVMFLVFPCWRKSGWVIAILLGRKQFGHLVSH